MIEKMLAFIKNNWELVLCVGLVTITIIAVCASFFISEKKNEKYKKLLAEQSNSVRIFIIDVANNSVRFFNSSSLSNVRNWSLGEFYSQFPSNEQRRVIDWVNALVDSSTEAPDYLETDVQISGSKKQYFSLLQVESVDQKKQVIHMQSYLLKYMHTSKNSAYNVSKYGLSTIKDLSTAFPANKRRGFTACFRFQYKKILDKDKPIEPLIFSQLKNAMFPYVNAKSFLLQCSENELVVSDIKNSERVKMLYLINTLINAINRYLSINGLLSSVELRVGAIEHKRFVGTAEDVVDQARRTAQIAYDDLPILLWYEKGRESLNPLNDASYRTEVERIINEKKLSYFFRPIYSVQESKVIGYFSKATPKDTYFGSLDELKDYASRTDDSSALFSTLAKNILPIFVSERKDETEALFYPVRTEERGYMLTTFARLSKAKQSHIVFIFEEGDIKSHFYPTNPDAVIDDMRAIKAKGYEVALFLNEGELELPPQVYTAFDYFVCGFAFAGSASEMDTQIRSQLHALVEKLLKYGKPIIATDIEGWASIELLVRSGLKYISSESFAPFDQMILPVPQKSIKRVKDMTK